jgi:hypothetical protein
MKDNKRHLIFEETCFDERPDHVRHQDSWQRLKSGEFANLRPDYRQAICEYRFIIVEESAGVFSG